MTMSVGTAWVAQEQSSCRRIDLEVTFAEKRVEALWRRARKARRIADGAAEGWSTSNVGPLRVLRAFSALRLRTGFTLRAYQFRAGGNGEGYVYAMPERAVFPPPEQWPSNQSASLAPPRPPQALEDIMDAVEGDGTPWSYFSASLFAREISEFGAMWHGESWNTHRILATDAMSIIQRENESSRSDCDPSVWTWEQPVPQQWEPRLVQSSDSIKLVFHSFTGLGQQQIVQHTDEYQPRGYRFRIRRRVIAWGPLGYIY
jgi:hypothetical protein